MKIAPFLRPEFIQLDMRATTRENALLELTQFVKTHPHVKDFASFCRSVHEREALGPTAIPGHDIAIPHARTDQVADILFAVGRSRDGIVYEGKEPVTVKLVFLMGIPKKMVTEYLQLLGSLAKLLKEQQFRAALLAAQTPAEFLAAFEEVENRS